MCGRVGLFVSADVAFFGVKDCGCFGVYVYNKGYDVCVCVCVCLRL